MKHHGHHTFSPHRPRPAAHNPTSRGPAGALLSGASTYAEAAYAFGLIPGPVEPFLPYTGCIHQNGEALRRLAKFLREEGYEGWLAKDAVIAEAKKRGIWKAE